MDTNELITRAHNGDKMAKDELVLNNLGLVYSVSQRFVGRGIELEDIRQIGSIGLIKAIDRFDTSLNVMFSTYAVPMIIGEIKRYIRDDGIIKISRSIKENRVKLAKLAKENQEKTGRELSALELSRLAEMPLEDVVCALESSYEVDSLYREVNGKDESERLLMDRFSNRDGICTGINDDAVEKVDDRMLINQLMNYLTDTEKEILKLRYYGEMTQQAVANKLNLSQVQVSRMEKKILCKLRAHIV